MSLSQGSPELAAFRLSRRDTASYSGDATPDLGDEYSTLILPLLYAYRTCATTI